MVYPFAGFFGQASDYPLDPAEQEIYVRYTIARLGPYWNMLFNVADPEPIAVPDRFNHTMPADVINRLGRLVQKHDVFGHPLSIHNGSQTTNRRGDPSSMNRGKLSSRFKVGKMMIGRMSAREC